MIIIMSGNDLLPFPRRHANINKMKKPKIAVVGPGVVGKATGRAFLAKGLTVGFIARSEEQIKKLQNEGYTVHSRTDLMQGDYDYDITMLTVSTPTHNGKINLDAMELAAIDLGKRLKKTNKYHLVVVKSTCPPGTTENLVIKTIEEYSGKKVGKDFGACMNPEYLREISAFEDSVNPWVVVIGEYDKKSGDFLMDAYEDFTCPIYRCGLKEAEMQKYIHNLYNATKITFFNEMRVIADAIGVNSEKIFKYTGISCEGMWNVDYGTKDRGPFSGACLPKDTKAFFHYAKTKGINLDLLEKVISVNEQFKEPEVHPEISHKPSTNGQNGKGHQMRTLEKIREAEQNTDYTL